MMNDSHLLTGNNSLVRLALKRRLVGLFASALVAGSVHRTFFRQLGMPDKQIFEGYDTVDNEYFGKAADSVRAGCPAWRARLGLPRKYILSLGRFVKKKNLELVVAAYARALASGRLGGYNLVFVGSGPEKARLLTLTRKLGLPVVDRGDGGQTTVRLGRGAGDGGEKSADEGPRTGAGGQTTADGRRETEGKEVPEEAVYFLPFAQIDTVPAFYALASCFVLASQTDEWGLVVNEAMACGTPVLVSRFVGCAPDLVVPGVTGYRFNPDTPEELAWRFQQVCGNEALQTKLGAGARAHVAGWSNERFAESALKAAEAALLPRTKEKRGQPEEPAQASVTVLQTCFPDYRESVFDELSRRLGQRFSLISGRNYFTAGITPCSEFKDWHLPVSNRFLGLRNFLWQHNVVGRAGDSDVAVLELNPRILSNWVILAGRRLAGAPTLLWGHVWGRHGVKPWTNVLRLMMMRLAHGVISYSHSQAEELKRILPGKPVHVAPNSLISRSRCRPALIEVGETVTDIVFVGRLIAEKKPALLLRAFRGILSALPPEIRLIFVGAGAERALLENEADQIGCRHRVVFHGHVSDEELLRRIYSRAFCSVSPGYVGLSAVQSFAHGVPMVIADREPHAPEIEICREEENAMFFTAGNEVDLGKVLLRMWDERQHWLDRRAAIATAIGKNYSAEAMVDGYMEAIEAVIVRHGLDGGPATAPTAA